VLGRDAGAGVADKDLDDVVVAGKADGYLALLGVLNSVIKEVGDDFADAVGVDIHIVKRAHDLDARRLPAGGVDGATATDDKLAVEPLLGGTELEILRELLQERTHLDNRRVVGEPPIFGLGAGEQVLEELAEVFGAGMGFF